MADVNSTSAVVPGTSNRDQEVSLVEKPKRSEQTVVFKPENGGNEALRKIANESALADKAVDVTSITISPERLAELVKELKASMPESAKSLRFHMDEVLDRPIVTVVDKNSGTVIRQLPSEEVIRAVHNIDYMRGILFDDLG